MGSVPRKLQKLVTGNLFELPEKIDNLADTPENWVLNSQVVDLWANYNKYNTYGVNYFRRANGNLVVNLPIGKIEIPAEDELGRTVIDGKTMNMQDALFTVFRTLLLNYRQYEYIWNKEKVAKWGSQKPSQSQIDNINKYCPKYDTSRINKGEASQILNRLFYSGKKENLKLLNLTA